MKNPCIKITPLGYERELTASDARRVFGLGVNDTLPNADMTAFYDGPRGTITMHLVPKSHGLVNQRSTKPHRIFAVCPKCGGWVPFGRMGQHVKRRSHQEKSSD